MGGKMEGSSWDKVVLQLSKDFSDELSKCSSHDLIKFCLENKTRNLAQNFLNNIKKSKLKDGALALQKKEEGNAKYKKKQFEESLSLYTESIFQANKNDECLPLAFSNRSIVLELLGYSSEALTDIDLALECGYPKSKVENLIIRKSRCLMQLGDVEKAREVLTEALKNCEKKEYCKIIENELKKIKGNKGKKSSSSEFKLPELVGGENQDFSYASNHLSVYYDETKGRHVIANQDIEPGDVLFVEKPFSFVAFGKLCSNCMKAPVAPIPCWSCSSAFYCSPKCRDDSWNSVHFYECGFDELFKSIGIAHLSLRVILKASSSFNELKEILSNISEPAYKNGSIVRINNEYDTVYSLIQNFEKYEAKEMFQYVMTALLLALYLKNHTRYFPVKSDDEDLKLVTSVILRHILQLICNGFCISKVSSKVRESKWHEQPAEVKSGSALYISASMMNHSCEPSIIFGFHLSYLIVRARKAIKKGEEVFISYGVSVQRVEKAKRLEILSKQYFFECKCQSCLQKYDLQDKIKAFKCNECKGPSVPVEENSRSTVCLCCGQNSEITLEIARKHNKFLSLMTEGEKLLDVNVTLCLRKFMEAWMIGREIFYKFHVDLTAAADQVARCLSDLREFKKCISFLKCCVRSVEEQFGFLSYELPQELKKLADIITVYLINNKNAEDAKDMRREGLLYYGKLQKILSLLPEIDVSYEDTEINVRILESLRI